MRSRPHGDPVGQGSAPAAGYGHFLYDGGSGYPYTPPSPIDLDAALRPLIRQCREYDGLRVRLEEQGGDVKILNDLTRLLQEPVVLHGRHEVYEAALTKPDALRAFLNDAGLHTLRLQVRRLLSGMPAYYLCRVRQSYWDEYALVVEDYYQSPGYPMTDPRFVHLMYLGKETYHLRLSPFREDTRTQIEQLQGASVTPATYPSGTLGALSPGLPVDTVDQLLFEAGRHIFQAAWHEDQIVGVLAARRLNLPTLNQAIELLYLCLSGDLCELRRILSEPLCRFFEQVYVQPAIARFLRRLPEFDGRTLNLLSEERAQRLYRTLMGAFRRFLDVKVSWGMQRSLVPLYKLLFANIARLDLIADDLRDEPAVRDAGTVLEAAAQHTIDEMVSPS